MSFKEALQELREDAKNKNKKLREKRKELDKSGIVYCPRCLSTQISANQKGYGIGKGVAGAIVAGPLGLAVGMLGKNNIKCTCLKCGYKFKAGSKI